MKNHTVLVVGDLVGKSHVILQGHTPCEIFSIGFIFKKKSTNFAHMTLTVGKFGSSKPPV